MNQEKNHWLALYLSGKYPGYFRTPDKLLFIDELQSLSPTIFSDEKIKMFGMFGEINEYEFYLSFLNKVQRGGKFTKSFSEFLDDLKIPKEIQEQSLKGFFDYELLSKEFAIVKADTDKTTKGTKFEEFLKKFFDSIDGLSVVEISQASDEQIDLVIKNNVNRPFWINLGSSLFIGEAKHTSALTKTEAIKKVIGTLDGHKNFSKIGVFISMEGFTKEKDEIQKRTGGGEKIVATIQGLDFENIFETKQNPIDWLEEKITNAFR